MNEYKFDLEKFRKFYGKKCPCLPQHILDEEKVRCPCEEFMKEGKCRCNLFKKVEEAEKNGGENEVK